MNRLLCAIAFSSVYIFMTTGCGEVGFSTSKSNTLGKSSVFGGENGEANGEINQPGDEPGVEINRICSNDKSKASGNVQQAQKVIAIITDSSKKEVCAGNLKDYRSDLINMDKLSFALPCALADGKYKVSFFDQAYVGKSSLGQLEFELRSGAISYKENELKVIYASNPEQKGTEREAYHEKCDDYASPLVVQLGHESIGLSAPLSGIDFDILGSSAGHAAQRISWFANESFAFIALPNSDGEVLGIDQLFGDNTLGPDARLSENGYAALAKHDGNHDGLIDKKDKVYRKLRLWIDRNGNGRSDLGELESLRERGILSVDLAYEAGYSERDAYGNKILFKSVAEHESGEPLLIFDIWFRLAN